MDKYIQIEVAGLVVDYSVKDTYSLILSETEGDRRRFSILIGEPEAQSIALKINKRRAPRPLTHDLIISILHEFDANIEKVIIYRIENNVFFSEIYLIKNNEKVVIDSRTSDAIALALRDDIPIFIAKEILDKVGRVLPNREHNSKTDREDTNSLNDLKNIEKESANILSNLKEHSSKTLLSLLKYIIKIEDYESAIRIREELREREENGD